MGHLTTSEGVPHDFFSTDVTAADTPFSAFLP